MIIDNKKTVQFRCNRLIIITNFGIKKGGQYAVKQINQTKYTRE